MPHGVEVHVVPRNLHWEVRVNGVARPLIDWLCTKERAIDHARERAAEVDADAIVIESSYWTVEAVVPVERRRRHVLTSLTSLTSPSPHVPRESSSAR